MLLPRLLLNSKSKFLLTFTILSCTSNFIVHAGPAQSPVRPCDAINPPTEKNTVSHQTSVSHLLRSTQQKLSELENRRLELHNRIMFPSLEADNQFQALLFWREITDKFIFDDDKIDQINQEITDLEQAKNTHHCHHILKKAQTLQQNAYRLIDDFKSGEWLYEAQNSAKVARADLMMYRMMKYVKGAAPALDNARNSYAKAEVEMTNGNLTLALIKWQQAAKAYNEDAFREVIDGFKNNGDDAIHYAKTRLKAIRKNVTEQLKDYFIRIPSGEFIMGSETGNTDEKPTHLVKLEAFKLGNSEIPFSLWDLCVEVRMCLHKPNDDGWGREDHPVIHVSHNDITEQFIPWLSFMTGNHYQLPTEAQWEYAARANATSSYPWGDDINCTQARFNGGFTSECPAQKNGVNLGTRSVKSYSPNNFGLYDMQGNVWEWVQDCYRSSYPLSHKLNPNEYGQCEVAVLRGGSWKEKKDHIRVSNRFYFAKNARTNNFGFRLVELAE